MVARFYSGDPEVGGRLGEGGVTHRLGLAQTLPALLTFTVLNGALLATPEGRGVYWKVAVVGTLFGWVWMSLRS